MNKRLAAAVLALPLALVAALAAPMASAAGDRPEVGGVKKLEGGATATYEQDKRDLAVPDPVYFQDLLETVAGGRLAVKLKDDTMLTLGENGSLRIDEFVYAPEDKSGRLGLSVLEGAFLFVGGKTEDMDDSKVDINTSVGTLGVRGTTVWGGHIDGSFGVFVSEGEVTVRNAGGEVDLGPGEGTMVASRDAAPSAPKKWPEEKVRRALKTVAFQSN